MLKKSILPLVILALLAGCASAEKKSSQAHVKEQWNRARANVMFGLARDQYTSGNFDPARKTVGDGLRLDPDNEPLLVLSARLAIEGGQLDLADRALEKAHQLNSKDPEADYLSGVVNQRWQKLDRAAEFYESAAQKNPDELAYHLAHSEMLIALGRPEEALRLLQNKVVYFENSAVIRDAVGQLLVQFHKYPEAADMLRQGCILDPSDDAIREHFAMALVYSKQYKDAIEPL